MKLNPHLNFNGNCAEAYRFYEQHLGAKPRRVFTSHLTAFAFRSAWTILPRPNASSTRWPKTDR